MILLEVILAVTSGLTLVPCLVVFSEVAIALLPGRKSKAEADETEHPPTVVLVPAHDEESVIEDTVAALLVELSDRDRVMVVADNCTDKTAEIARKAGAIAIERHDLGQRGKGHALAFGVAQLSEDPPAVVIVIDADCRVGKGTIGTLARTAFTANRPVQADNSVTPSQSPGSMVSALAFLVRNRVRPTGLHRLGLPVHLSGTGMAFPWPILRDAPATGSWLVEDLLLGIELTILGHAPLLCREAQVTSGLPERGRAATGQRRRWEHGQLSTMLRQAPRLFWKGLVGFRLDLVALGLDLAVPPLALLVVIVVLLSSLGVLIRVLGASWYPALVAGCGLGLIAVSVAGAWVRFGRKIVPLRYVLAVPFYVLWKVPLYLSFFMRRRQKTWERTER